MPSVNSSSVPAVLDSSTVMTPSLPTLSNASAMRSPIVGVLRGDGRDVGDLVLAVDRRAPSRAGAALSASTAASMPRLRSIGVAPAATLRRPSRTIAWASTVAVVVPSPATSLVLVATSLASWAPRFSYGSSSSISRAMVTPSLVIVGAPHFLSMTTLRPRRAERHLDGVGERVDAALEAASGVLVELQDLGHEGAGSFLACRRRGAVRPDGQRRRRRPARDVVRVGRPGRLVRALARSCVERSAQSTTMARTSRAERRRYSSPSYLTSVPPYLL